MPKPAAEVFRDFVRFTGDGLPGAPANAQLPTGDPQSGVHHPDKASIREWATYFEQAVSSGSPVAMATVYAVQPLAVEGYYRVEYSSGRSDLNQYGYTANVKRTGGTRRPVAAQLNAYSLDPAGSAASSVFGIACEAWTGDATTNAQTSAGLKGIEPAVISQYHANDQNIWGMDVVFKNRRDGGSVLHGSIGSNAFNRYSHALHISSQGRSPLGEYCGWNTGIYFASSSLDASIDGPAIGIDFRDAPTARMSHAIALADLMSIGFSGNATSGVDVSIRYVDSSGRVQFRNGGTAPVEVMVAGGNAGVAINGTKVIGGQGAAIANAAAGTEATTINAILARLRAHGLIAT